MGIVNLWYRSDSQEKKRKEKKPSMACDKSLNYERFYISTGNIIGLGPYVCDFTFGMC